MNPYAMLGAGTRTNEAASLSARLSAWHDAMVAHERRLRAGGTNDVCDDECPHAEAPALWCEAVATFGARALELTFLRSRGDDVSRRSTGGSAHGRSWRHASNSGAPRRQSGRGPRSPRGGDITVDASSGARWRRSARS